MNFRYLCFFLLSFLVPGLQSCSEGGKTIRGMYVMETRITGLDEISPENLDGYDFFYLVMTPAWTADDFGCGEDGTAKASSGGFMSGRTDVVRKFISTAHSVGAKVLLCLQGADFVRVAPDEDKRKDFAAVTADFVRGYGFDGIDLDWEITVTPELHLLMMRQLRQGLDGLGGRHYLTTALNCGHRYTQEQALSLSEVTDWINLMYYDMGGGLWGTAASHNAPLDAIMENYGSSWSVFDPSKIHIGLANYGYAYHDLGPGEEVPEGKTLADYMLPFWNVPDGWTEEWDGKSHVPYFFSPDGKSFMTAENGRSLREKADWIKEIGAGGFFWWEFHCDWDRATGKHALSDLIADDFSR